MPAAVMPAVELERDGRLLLARVRGRIDHQSAEDFRTRLDPALNNCTKDGDRVILDLGGVDYISSAGLRVLMLAAKQTRPLGGTLVVANLQPVVDEIFRISRFDAVFVVYPTAEDAKRAVGDAASH